ncbi:MAG: ABC transporter permease subunit [Dehalococcoidia bacterium]|nr:MAG: ABC transporter permease subunit [Dehalococcoidia bacterium]
MAVVIVLYQTVPAGQDPGAAIDFPEQWAFGWEVMKFIDRVVDWVVVNWDPFFSAINVIVLRGILSPLEDFFLWLPWWTIIIITGVLAWRTAGAKFAGIAVGFLVVMTIAGLIAPASQTLAVTLTATMICMVFGLPVGIVAARSDRFDGAIRPILDGMQTMPSFVYLIPALMLFGLGKTPAVMATCIYAIPPIIRLTNLGIRQVDAQVVEAARSFGTTPWQLLTKVQVPMAMPTILAGLNQTVMMALAMVIIASMIGARGLGAEVLTGIARLEVGRGFIAGISIVFMAIILDRVSQGFARRPETRLAT